MALDKQHEVRRAYYSAVSHADDQVGRMVDGLKALGVWNSTSLGNSVEWTQVLLIRVQVLLGWFSVERFYCV